MWFPPAEGLQGGQSGGGRRSDAAPFGAPGWFPTSPPPWDRAGPPAPGTSAYGEPGEVECEDCDITVEGKRPKKPNDPPEDPVDWFPMPGLTPSFPKLPESPPPPAPWKPPGGGGPATTCTEYDRVARCGAKANEGKVGKACIPDLSTCKFDWVSCTALEAKCFFQGAYPGGLWLLEKQGKAGWAVGISIGGTFR